jgi:hypothetical protein
MDVPALRENGRLARQDGRELRGKDKEPIEHEQYKWYSWAWEAGQRPVVDDAKPAGISRGDHKRVVQLARHMINVRLAHKDAD